MASDITFESEGVVRKWLVDAGLFQRIENNSLVEERPFNADDVAWVQLVQAADASGSGDLLARVRTALTVDNNYLAKVQAGTVTQQEHINQVPALTRQLQALLVYTVLRPN